MTFEKNNETKNQRPSWGMDEYFLEMANAVSTRATCDRGRSGCVITKNKQILVSGYVGSPAGFAHCDEVGHQMKDVTHEDGSVHQSLYANHSLPSKMPSARRPNWAFRSRDRQFTAA